MLIVTAKLSKKKCAAAAILTIVIAVLVVTLVVKADRQAKQQLQTPSEPQQVANNEERLAYLASLGWETEQTPVETQEVKIPETFPEILEKYNEFQKQQGHDLQPYAGKQVKRYVYEITNHPGGDGPYYATLFIYQGKVIGGDVTGESSSSRLSALKRPDA